MKGKFLCNILISAIFCLRYASGLSGTVPVEASYKPPFSINCGSGKAIFVTEASYGKNCNPELYNNQKDNLAEACDDKTSCSYKVDHTKIGDPSPGCGKTYVYQYECAQIKTGSLAKEATRKVLTINCNSGQINILSASYGKNCNSGLYNNDKDNLGSVCDGLPTCSYRVDHTIIGDPAGGCPKTYEYSYNCIESCIAPKSGSLPAESSGKTLNINCNGNGVIDIVSASYGQNCNFKLYNNQEGNLAAACNGKTSCSYRVDHGAIGDPAGGCPKTYVYRYYCVAAIAGEGVGVFPFNTVYTINVSESATQIMCGLIGLFVILQIVLIYQLSCKKSKVAKAYVPVKYNDSECMSN